VSGFVVCLRHGRCGKLYPLAEVCIGGAFAGVEAEGEICGRWICVVDEIPPRLYIGWICMVVSDGLCG